MIKKAVSVAEISSLIAVELGKHAECADVWPAQIFWHRGGGSSCWDMNIFANNDANAEACDDRVRMVVQDLRGRYNVFEPG